MKKLISIFLLVAMLISMIPCVALSAAATGETEDTTTTEIPSVKTWTSSKINDAVAEEYSISTVDELKFYADTISENDRAFKLDTVYLMKDLTFNESVNANPTAGKPADGNVWPEITQATAGNFDGQGHTIRGIYQGSSSSSTDKSGLFGCAYYNGTITIKNVKFENCYSESAASANHGFLFGSITKYGYVTVENVSFENCYSKSSAGTSYGFLCGKVTNSTASLTVKNVSFENCHSESSATSGSGQGFLCGTVTGSAKMTIENVSIGNCSSTSSVTTGQGSLCGVVNGGSTVTVNNVYVDARSRIVNGSATGNADGIGGLIGGMPWDTSHPTVTITNSVFAGSIEVATCTDDNTTTNQEDFRVIGGLIGTGNSKNVTIQNSASYATFKRTEETTTDLVLVGGILGYQSSTGSSVTVENCISACTNEITGEKVIYGSVLGAGRYKDTTTYAYVKGPGNVTTSENSKAIGCAWYQYKTTTADYDTTTTDGDETTDYYTGVCSGSDITVTYNANIRDNFATVLHGYQAKDTVDNKFDFRLVATVDVPTDVTVDKVGFVITATYGDTRLTKNYSTNTVYEKVTGNTTTGLVEYTAEKLGGDYIFALAITGAPTNAGNITLKVTTYYVSGGNTVYGATEVFTVTAPQYELN